MSRVALYIFGTFFGTGFAPVAPATVASLAVAVLWWIFAPLSLSVQLGLLIVVTAVGIPVSSRLEERHGDDPRIVVCDEVAGMLVTYLGITTGPAGWIVGFFWFRVFDILKPFPARRLEGLPRGWGIMADDLAAGVYAHIALRLTLLVTGW